KDSFFQGVAGDIYQNRFNYQTDELNDIFKRSLDHVLSAVLRILRTQLEMQRGVGKETLALSVKAIVTGQMARTLCKLSPESASRLEDLGEYVITLERDADSRTFREVRQAVFTPRENTDFARILAGDVDDFLSNDLSAERQYKNENRDHAKFYNATLVVPI